MCQVQAEIFGIASNGARHLESDVPPLIVLHGGPGGNHRGLIPLTELADSRAVVLYDQLDSGHSERPGDPDNWNAQRFVDEIATVRDALGINQYVVLGHSAGGAWAAMHAIEDHVGLRGVILSSPLLSTSLWLADAAVHRAALPEEIRATLARNEMNSTTDSAEYLAATEQYYNRHLCRTPCEMGDLTNDRPPFNAALYEFMWGPTEFRATGTLRDFDLTPSLADIKVPVAIVCGEFDEARPATWRALCRSDTRRDQPCR